MTWLRTKGYAIHRVSSVSHVGKTAVWEEYIRVSEHSGMKTGMAYHGSNKFSDEGGEETKGNLIYYKEPNDVAYCQYDWFALNKASGLTQSIEAFVYGILRVQVNFRCSVFGKGGENERRSNSFSSFDGRRSKATRQYHQPRPRKPA